MEHNYKLTDFKNIVNDSDTDILERIVSISLWNVEEMPVVIVHRVESMIKIIESNRLKKEAVENCKRDLQGKLSQEDLQKFEKVFYEVSAKYLFSRKGKK